MKVVFRGTPPWKKEGKVQLNRMHKAPLGVPIAIGMGVKTVK
jgi:hypothetical protein